MDHTLILVVVIVAIALFFDFTNGFHDAANSIATTVSTRVLSPKQAVLWAAFFNFIAFLIFGTTVANTVGKGLININVVTMTVILAGLIGTILWNLTTWYLGLPTSSSHALIGGYAGAAIAKAGFSVVTWSGWYKTIAFIFIAPAIGFILGAAFITIASWLLFRKTPQGVNRWSRRFQLVTAALYSLGHGGNDAQKTMGMNITKLRPIDAICAETGSAISIFSATLMGVPVSTTHVITGAISGVGAAKRMSAVKWGVTLRIVWAWIFTIPLSGIFAYLIYKLIGAIS